MIPAVTLNHYALMYQKFTNISHFDRFRSLSAICDSFCAFRFIQNEKVDIFNYKFLIKSAYFDHFFTGSE